MLKELIGFYIIYDSRNQGSALLIYFKHILKYGWVGSGLVGL